MDIQIRRARSDEAATLTEIAHAAKRHWGYPESWIKLWQLELTIAPEFIAGNDVFVAISDGQIAGCCALVLTGSLAELEHMWIRPDYIGTGLGRLLFERVQAEASARQIPELELSADPNAEGFYKHMGAIQIGEIAADIEGHARVLPRMRIKLGPSVSTHAPGVL